MKRSVTATRTIIEAEPRLEHPDRIWLGERHILDGEPIVITDQRSEDGFEVLEGWHATTGRHTTSG
jgi:hypothetical protein